jgi:hypothetical protein
VRLDPFGPAAAGDLGLCLGLNQEVAAGESIPKRRLPCVVDGVGGIESRLVFGLDLGSEVRGLVHSSDLFCCIVEPSRNG